MAVMRDSHKLLVTPYWEFKRHFGGKTVLAGLRLKSIVLMIVSKLTFKVWFLFWLFSMASGRHPALAPSVSDRGSHEKMELISTRHFNKFSVWSRGRTYPLFEDIISYPYPGPKKGYYILSLSRQKKGYGYISYILCQNFCQHCHSFWTTKSQTW
jgi:hypothetical protein